MTSLIDLPPDPGHALTAPDAVVGLDRDGELMARAALWWRQPLVLPDGDGPTGRIGHAAWDDADDGAALISLALDRLRAEGCQRALGPIDGSTWHTYRVVTASDDSPPRPPFALEPWPAPAIGAAFEQAGFAPQAHYLSSIVNPIPDDADGLAADLARLPSGLSIRPFQSSSAEAELRALHGLLLRSFAGNVYYAPLDLDRYLALYRPLVARIDPSLVLIAEADRQPVGVLLALPDWAQAARGEAVDTVIIKTLAVDPEWRGLGLGGTLVRAAQEAARAQGYRRAIHALMHADNDSVRISRHLGRPFRRYALLGRTL